MTRKFLLPFATPAEDREEPFTKEMERATILCLVELERGKGEGFILKKPTEKVIFVAETCYPIWLVPWGGRSLLFDGFGIMSHTLTYDVPPDTKTFINNIQASEKKYEAYSAFLSGALNYFHGFTDHEEKLLEGLIASPEFIQDFASYLQEARAIRRLVLDKVFLTPTIDESTISSFIREFSNLRTILKEDIDNLRKSMKLLNATTRKHLKATREEIKEIQKKFDERIASLEPSVLKKVQRIRKKYDVKITRLSKKFDKQLYSLHHERVKLEKTMEGTTAKIDRCEAEIKSCKLREDEACELRWKRELKEHRKELSTQKKKIEDVNGRIKGIEATKRLELSKIRSEYDVKAEDAMKRLKELEASRDAKIQMSQQEMKALEEMTSAIIDQIDKLVMSKETALNELEKIGISQRRRKPALAYLPLYLACYQTGLKKRYVLYPPSVVESMGIWAGFKRILGVAKIKSLLRHRSKSITSLLNQLLTVIELNPVFEKEINDAGIKAHILRTRGMHKKIKIGLEGLRNEGWISESEFLRKYYGI